MDQKERIRKAIDVLANAIDWGFDEIDASKMGPLGFTKASLKALPHAQLLALPGFAGTWLHMLSAEVHGEPVADQVILSMMFPPAAMLAAQAPTDEARAILTAGATSSIRPPNSELLVLSPATADAVVYELTGRGLTRIASDVAELVENEVDVAVGRRVGTTLPSYGFDGENWAVVVAGCRVGSPRTQGDVKRLQAAVRTFAEKSGLPLAYVHMGSTVGSDDDTQVFEGIVGWVLAHASGRSRATVSRASLETNAAEKIPADFFATLASEHGVTFGEFAVHLAPAGWSGARLMPVAGDEDEDATIQTWAEDTEPGRVLDVAALPEQFYLKAEYA